MEFEKLKEFNNKYVEIKYKKFITYGEVEIKDNKFYLNSFEHTNDGDFMEFKDEFLLDEIEYIKEVE